MEALIEKLPYVITGGFFLLILIAWELHFPETEIDSKIKKRSYVTNALIFITNNGIFLAFQLTTIYALAYTYRLHDWWEVMPVWVQLGLGIIILDFIVWFWHWLSHNNNLLWAFHKTHHSEMYLNATSAIRFHAGELVMSLIFKAVFLVLLGVPYWIFVINELLITVFAAFHHSNIRLPQQIQNILEKIIITPDLHRVHHSAERFQHDTNYGVIFSWWDRILGTRLVAPVRMYGLKGIGEKKYVDFLLFPLKKK